MIRRPPRSTLFPYTRSSDLERPELDAAGVRFTVGSHTLDFVAPRGRAGPLAEWLVAPGASPYAPTFRGPTPGTLAPANTPRAPLTLGPRCRSRPSPGGVPGPS